MKYYRSLVVLVFVLNSLTYAQSVLHVDDGNNTGSVNGSTNSPYPLIRDAVQAAASGDTIKVAAGTYRENITVNNKTVILLAGYRGASSSDYASGSTGDFSERNSQSNVCHIAGDGSDTTVSLLDAGNSMVDGFTISGGTRSQIGLPYFAFGGGIICQGGSPTISNNIIENNDSRQPDVPETETIGGGIYCEDADVTIQNNVIRNNISGLGGGVAAINGNVNILNNLVQDNVAMSDHGGGLYISCPLTLISRNEIRGNQVGPEIGYGWGGGIIVFGEGVKAALTYNRVTANLAPTSGSGTFIDDGAEAVLQNELIYANGCGERGGAGLYVDGAGEGYPGEAGSKALIDNCTVVNNASCSAEVEGNGLVIERNSEVTVINSIFWDNGDDFSVDGSSRLTVTYTNSKETIAGEGNLSNVPLFADPGNHDYHLQSAAGRWNPFSEAWIVDTQTSPCIDAGNPASDYSNEPASNGARVNLGVYGNTAEASRSTGPSSVTPGSQTPQDFILFQNFPNPFNPTTVIQYNLPKTTKMVLKIYNTLGREVRTLIDEQQTAGKKSVIWDGRDRFGEAIGSGVYIYQIRAGDYKKTRKMVLLH